MAFEVKPGSFSLFKNDKKTADNHPDYTGHGKDPEGRVIRIALWKRESKAGDTYLSCTMKYDEEQQKPQRRPARHEQFDKDVPF